MTHKALFRVLCEQVEVFAARQNALDVLFTEEKECSALWVELRVAAVEFVFTRKNRTTSPANTLFCRVYPAKNIPHPYHLPELWDVLGQTDFPALYFPYIESERRMVCCFAQLSARLTQLLPAMEMLAPQEEQLWERVKAITPDAVPPEGVDEDLYWLALRAWQERKWLCYRFTLFPGWRAYAEGDREKALAAYEAYPLSVPYPYEEELCAYLRGEEIAPPFAPDCDGVKAMHPYREGSAGDFGRMILCWVAAFLLLAVPFTLLTAAVTGLFSWGTLYCACEPWSIGLLWAGVPCVFCGLGFRRQLWRLLWHRRAAALCAYDDMVNSPLLYRVLGVFCAVLLTGCVVGVVLTGWNGIRFYDDRVEQASLWHTASYAYTDVVELRHIQARENAYGEPIARDSYMLVFSDGTEWDLDGYTTPEQTEQHILVLPDLRELPITEVPLLPFEPA